MPTASWRWRRWLRPDDPLKLCVLASGSGTNLQAILDKVHGQGGNEVVAVACNNAEARALERARTAGVETSVFDVAGYKDRQQRDLAMAQWLAGRGAELAVLAGYMELVSPAFFKRFPKGVINVHPSLLPAFPGLHSIEKQLDYGCKVGGVTVHFVDEGVDSGPIILQQAVELPASRDPDEALELLHLVEHRILPQAVELIAAGAVTIDSVNPRIVHVKEEGS